MKIVTLIPSATEIVAFFGKYAEIFEKTMKKYLLEETKKIS